MYLLFFLFLKVGMEGKPFPPSFPGGKGGGKVTGHWCILPQDSTKSGAEATQLPEGTLEDTCSMKER